MNSFLICQGYAALGMATVLVGAVLFFRFFPRILRKRTMELAR